MANEGFSQVSSLDKYKDLPSNSYKTKAEKELEEKEKKPEVKKITTGMKKKKSFGKRFKETFLSEETDSVGEYLLWDIFIPAAKDTLHDLVTGFVDTLLFGGARTGSSRKSSSRTSSIVSYNKISEGKRGQRVDTGVRRNRKSVDDIIICDRSTAMQVLDDMNDLVQSYGQCTVADYYDMVDCEYDFADKYWGWRDLRGARPVPVKGGVILELPDVEQL